MALIWCENDHSPIVFDQKEHNGICPLCEALWKIEDLEGEIGYLEDKIEELEDFKSKIENEG